MTAYWNAKLAPIPQQFVLPVFAIALIFAYLGLPPHTALLASLLWMLIGATGGWLIEALLGELDARYRLPIALGPGALLALGLVVFLYLSVQGGLLGLSLVIGGAVLGAVLWARRSIPKESSRSNPKLLLAFVGLALLANSKEFPNLLLPSVGVVTLAVIVDGLVRVRLKLFSAALVVALLVNDMLTRPSFWWWSSDDTTTLAGIGTMVIERGRVADTAGWETGSHHWLLHAWLAFWNSLSAGQVFETYQIAWPVVAAVSMFASLWLCVEAFFGEKTAASTYIITGIVTAGLVRLEWPAPQEQQPFLFAMIACCALWLRSKERNRKLIYWRSVAGVVTVLIVVPSILFVLKPSLLVAHFLLLLGVVLVHFECYRGWRLVVGLIVTFSAITLGIFTLWIASSWISDRSFTSFAVKWFPGDLGWCSYSALPGSLACVVSLQALLVVATLLSLVVLKMSRDVPRTLQSMFALGPLVIAYLPLRYFISSGVGSGAPSFYRLSEMTMMLIVALGVSFAWGRVRTPYTVFIAASGLSLVIYSVGRMPSEVYDLVDKVLVASRAFRFVSPADAIALVLALATAITVSSRIRFEWPSKRSYRHLVAFLLIVALLPIARLTTESATGDIDPGRLSRPSDFGPPDIEAVGDWMKDRTNSSMLFATNYLCPDSRLDECRYSVRQTVCKRRQPVLMASWALTALSGREFTYLSQMWDSHSLYYFDHRTATRLGSELSLDAVGELEDLGVSKYVASREHTNPEVWFRLLSVADFATDHFIVVSLPRVSTLLTS
jgi:hypothetical protein